MSSDEYVELLESILQKAFGKEMNSVWSAWANYQLTEDEKIALSEAGVEIKAGVSEVTLATKIRRF